MRARVACFSPVAVAWPRALEKFAAQRGAIKRQLDFCRAICRIVRNYTRFLSRRAACKMRFSENGSGTKTGLGRWYARDSIV